jgi:hypothetical protein
LTSFMLYCFFMFGIKKKKTTHYYDHFYIHSQPSSLPKPSFSYTSAIPS